MIRHSVITAPVAWGQLVLVLIAAAIAQLFRSAS